MNDIKQYKIFESKFTRDQISQIQNYVIKKLNVKDLGQLRDRFEGDRYLIKTTKRILIVQTLLKLLNIENSEKIKIGFLNALYDKAIFGNRVLVLEHQHEINKIQTEIDCLCVSINLESRNCKVFSKQSNLDLSSFRAVMLEGLRHYGDEVYQ